VICDSSRPGSGFNEALAHAGGGKVARSPELVRNIYACLIAEATPWAWSAWPRGRASSTTCCLDRLAVPHTPHVLGQRRAETLRLGGR